MDIAVWNNEKLKAFYELVVNSQGSLSSIPKGDLLQCWKCLQFVTSLNDLPISLVNPKGLLRNHEIQSFLLDNPEFWPKLGLTLLKLPCTNHVSLILSELVDRICNNGTKLHEALLEKIWSKRDDLKLPTKTFDQIMDACPFLMEDSIRCLLVTEMESPDSGSSWKSPQYSIIVKLASRSPVIFQLVTSIMNESLIQSKFNSRVINVIEVFVRGLKSLSNKNPYSFVSLYPLELQSLVTFLVLRHTEFQYLPQRDKDGVENLIDKKLLELMNEDLKAFLCLSTHFPASFRSFKERHKS